MTNARVGFLGAGKMSECLIKVFQLLKNYLGK